MATNQTGSGRAARRPGQTPTIGVAYAADPGVRTVVVRAHDPLNLAMTTRKTVRDTLVGFCEHRGHTMLHASVIADDQRVVIVAGDKGSGKTTLALRGALVHKMRYISNDHLIIYPDGGTDTALSGQLVPCVFQKYVVAEGERRRTLRAGGTHGDRAERGGRALCDKLATSHAGATRTRARRRRR